MMMNNSLKLAIKIQFIMNLPTIVGLSTNNREQYQSNTTLENENWSKKLFEQFFSFIFGEDEGYLYRDTIYIFLSYFVIFIILLSVYITQFIKKKNIYINDSENLSLIGLLVHLLFSLVSLYCTFLPLNYLNDKNQYLASIFVQKLFIVLSPGFFITFIFSISSIFQFNDSLKLKNTIFIIVIYILLNFSSFVHIYCFVREPILKDIIILCSLIFLIFFTNFRYLSFLNSLLIRILINIFYNDSYENFEPVYYNPIIFLNTLLKNLINKIIRMINETFEKIFGLIKCIFTFVKNINKKAYGLVKEQK